MEWLRAARTVLSSVLLLTAILFGIDILFILFGGGINVTIGHLAVKSTTLEFPLIAFFCTGLAILIVRGQWREALLFCGAIVLACLIMEVVLRVMDHPLSKPYLDYVAWYEPAEGYGHRLVPNFEGFGPLNVPIKTNAEGFRDIEHQQEKTPGTLRVLGLGDSFLFGWGVARSETFLAQLEGRLRRATGRPVETINAGVPGWGLTQYYVYLKNVGVQYRPDVIVLAYFVDDLPGSVEESLPANQQYRTGLQFKGGACTTFDCTISPNRWRTACGTRTERHEWHTCTIWTFGAMSGQSGRTI